MNEDIIRMARKVGLLLGYPFTWEQLERFDALVRADEREGCAQLCEEHWRNRGNAMECADAIRARGNT